MTPVYLLSLPRSGSTLVQRVLADHEEISTVSEPWVLLPFLYTLKRRGIYTEYSHELLLTALEDFWHRLPRGQDDYLSELRAFILRLYDKASSKPSRYFLDKTPRYHLIIEEISRIFPDAKFIFLWRNPLAIVASIIETWGSGCWNVYKYKVDLFDGIENLVSAFEKQTERAFAIRYEDLVTGDDAIWRKLFESLDLAFQGRSLRSFEKATLDGRMGDPPGLAGTGKISVTPIEKWKQVLGNPVRKVWCRRYLRWIGKDRLAMMGYDLDNLIEELELIPLSSRSAISDASRMLLGVGFSFAEPYVIRDKLSLIRDWHQIHVHS